MSVPSNQICSLHAGQKVINDVRTRVLIVGMPVRVLGRYPGRPVSLDKLEPMRQQKLIQSIIVRRWLRRTCNFYASAKPHRKGHLRIVILHLLRNLRDMFSVWLPDGAAIAT